MGQLQISLFAPLQIVLDDKPISDFRTRKVMALLVYLAAEPETAHRRETLMTLLWPGMPDTSARANLRQVLFHLRKAIPDFKQADPAGTDEAAPLLFANRHTIQINPDAPIVIDASQFSALLEQVQAHDHHSLLTCNQCQENLEAATDLYTGHFLADFYLDDSNEFEEWAEIERQKYLRRTLDALGILTTIAIRQQAYAEARQHAERQLELDDFRESAYQQLMEILARNGQRNEAMSVYERCRHLFNDDLGMEPSARTTELYEQILAGDLRLDSLREQGVRGYELQEEIGSGAYGVIHRSVQPVIGREVAVKIIRRRYANDPDFIRRFEAEAQTIARLEHPHIVPIYDFWRDPDGAYLVMRLLRGGNLLTALEQGPWSLERTQKLLDQIAPALAAAHSQDIVHRDIKPANILFDENGNAYLSDFGIAKDLQNDDLGIIDGELLSTPDYISPEQIQEAPVSPRSDIYSLGAVLYEVLTGEKPFPDAPLITVIQNHLSTPLPLVCDSRPDLSPQIDAVIQQATAKEPADRFPDVLAFAEAFRQSVTGCLDLATIIAQAPVPVDVANPYKGLRAFQESDALDFYGRDNLIGQLLAHLSESRFLAVVGPSGSGKSSVVKAGVIPALRQGAIPGSEQWFVAEMTPGSHPLEELELALWPVAVDPPPSLVEPMQRDPRGLLRTIRRILPNEEGAQLLLVIDQFEELWSQTDPERRTYFLDSLMAAIAAPRSPLHVIITLRADFYDRPLQVQSLAELVKQHTELVLPLNQDELTWAIQEPARRIGVEFEDTVLSAIVAEVHDQPGALPLLQYALMELFEARSGSQIERRAFDDIGGVLGALPRRADEIYASLSPSEQAATRQFFLRLVTLDEGVEDTRRRVLLSELAALDLVDEQNLDDEASFEDIIDQFGAARLLTFDHDPLTRQPTVEVAHEALLREWNQLRTWLEESRDDVRLQRLLAAAVAEWQSSGQNPGYLLGGARLSQYEGWATSTTVALTADEQAYLADSIAAREARQAEEATRQARELETAKRLAETEHQRAEEQVAAAKNLRRRAYYLGAALVAAALLALIAIFAGFQANDNAQTAEANALAASTQEAIAAAQAEEAQRSADAAATAEAVAQESEAAAIAAQEEAVAQAEIARFNEAQAQSLALTSGAREAFTGGNVDLALALAVQAVSVEQPPTEAVRTLNDVAYAYGSRLVYENENQELYIDIWPSLPDGSTVVSEDGGRTLTVWDPNSSKMLDQFDVANGDAAFARRAMIPNSTYIAIAYRNDEIIVWDWSSGEKVHTLPGIDMTNVEEIFAGPGGNTLIYTSAHGASETDVDGVRAGFELTAWDIESGEQRYRLDGEPGEGITWVMASPDNRLALIGTNLLDEELNDTGTARLLIVDLGTGEVVSEPALDELAGSNIISSMSINPAADQALLIIGDAVEMEFGSTAVFLSLPEGKVMATIPFDTEIVYANYSPDGTLIAVERDSPSNNYFTLLDAKTGEHLRTLGSPNEGHTHIVNQGAFLFTPDGSRMVAGDQGGDMLVWDVATGEIIQRLSGHPGQSIFSVVLSPDGQTAITAGAGGDAGRLHFWDITDRTAARVFEEHSADQVYGLALSPDGTKAISTDIFAEDESGNEAILWDTSTFEVNHRLPGFYPSVAFLPDDRSAVLGEDLGSNFPWEGDLEMALVLWNIESGELLNRTLIPDSAVALDIEISPDGRSLLAGTLSNNMGHYDIETLAPLNQFSTDNEEEWLKSAAYSPDGKTAFAGGDVGNIIQYDLESGEEIRRYNVGSAIADIAFTADGQRFVSAGGDNTLVLWDVASGEAIQTYNGHTNEVTSVVFTPDESQIVSASADGTLILWDVASGEALRTFSEHSAWVNTVALSPDGQLAYSAADDGTVIVRPIAERSVDEIMAHIADNRVLRDFTCVERKQYRILPLCNANGVVPESSD